VDDCSDEFYCRRCGSPVHDWTGLYHFTEWQPVAKNVPRPKTGASSKRLSRRAG
jgi:hypothetical protein